MGIEETLYSSTYEKHLELEKLVDELLSHGKSVDKLKKTAYNNKLVDGIKYSLIAASAYFGYESARNFVAGGDYGLIQHMETALALSTGFLATHFHYSSKLSTAVYDKIFQKNTVSQKTAKKWKLLGRNSHLAGVLTGTAALSPILYAHWKAFPILTSAYIGLFLCAGYISYYRGYNALYNSWTDYLTGTRRH